MVFALEALNARFGDSLLLHYSQSGDPADVDAMKLIVIDGGPPGVWEETLQPTLEALRRERFPGDPNAALPIRLVGVSHIDADHISGIITMMRMLAKRNEDGKPLPYDIATLWHNSFDDLLGNDPAELTASFAASVASASAGGVVTGIAAELIRLRRPGHDVGHGEAITASVPQGRELRNLAQTLGLNVNSPFGGLVVAGRPNSAVDVGDGLIVTVVGPLEPEIAALQADWDLVLAKNHLVQTAEFIDTSVYNLSSIVVLAEMDGKRMLLTGDARGDKTLAGLEAAGALAQNGTMHVDLLKLPHHGSIRDVADEFFERIIADRYVISADGRNGNPDVETLQSLTRVRGGDEYTIYLTNHVPHADAFFAADQGPNRRYRVEFRADDAPLVRVAL